jgi:hypothetical protein
MTQSELIEIGAIVIGGLALIVVLSRGGSIQAATPAPETPNPIAPGSPEYLTYNIAQSYAGNSAELSPVAASQGGDNSSSVTPCACSSAPVMFASNSDYSNFLATANENLVQQYENDVLAATPSWLSQFYNNTLAPDMTAAAEGNFAAVAGLSSYYGG